ncbi:MAG: amino acid ABC transporter ATP-binding protein [Gemmataceae bacterium]|nr:amino acid ABC transporter ATP-binding protein [Gemmataceae bacterium]
MSLSIQVSNVTKRFGQRLVLNEVSVSIQPGQTVALLGPSGGGKSTLLRCLNGLNTFDTGEIRVGEHVIRSGQRHGPEIHGVRRLFGMVFQDFQLFPHLSVLENVIEAPLQVQGMIRSDAVERAEHLLQRVGLGSHLHAWPQQLSGGQKQRVAIARALAMQPRGLLCDEITSALDPEIKHEVLRVLEDLKRDGLTLILVTHEMGFARRAADRVVVLCDGRILEDGPPSQVLQQPRTERMQMFLQRVLG